ncbi:TIGR02646 family protein [Priestia megaterium]|uniref:TIGR02646 family protein n=1 Tax=Priestia megaterium TaxID=1404 RepID=UPI0012D897AA|nr:TIGR02646 family protein [Priestia megaterium]MUL33935.1 V-type ATP synthase subunit D [Priestia megaterium]
MRLIEKSNPPQSLTIYKRKIVPKPNYTRKKDETLQPNYYNDFRDKDDIRESLLDEQGYLCSYCMSRINKESMKIEHWASQSEHPELELDYKNMLGVCLGNKGRPYDEQCCDTHRGNQELTVNPTKVHTLASIKYRGNGIIYSDIETINKDLNITLNLNINYLKESRKRILADLLEMLNKKNKKEEWTESTLRKALKTYAERNSDNKLIPHCEVAIAFIKKRLRKFHYHT